MTDATRRDPPPIDWAAIRDAYVYGAQTVADICAAHAISHPMLYRMARLEGWPRRIDRATGLRRARARVARGGGSAHAPLVRRLYRRFERHVAALEARRDGAVGEGGDAPASAADSEKEARALASLARTLEKLIEIEDGLGRRQAVAQKQPDDHDIDRLRADLARRIAQLARSGPATPGGDGP